MCDHLKINQACIDKKMDSTKYQGLEVPQRKASFQQEPAPEQSPNLAPKDRPDDLNDLDLAGETSCEELEQRSASPDSTTTSEGHQDKPNSKWENFPVEQWRSAVYVNRAYFGDLCADTADFIVNIAETVKLSGRRVSLVEVGCGTGEFIRETADAFRVAIGVDFNPQFIEFCKQEAAKEGAPQQRYVQGDACALVDLMKTEFPPSEGLLWDDVRIVACVGNTIGIIPENLKEAVYKQMLELAGPSGVVIMAYWNAAWFGDAVQNFYHANPQLCGEFKGESIDLGATTLSTPSGYRTHWTSASEARAVMQNLGAEIISLKQKGKGVLVAARKLA